mmetsp:Transcript_22884/g.52412  ORF Transcript_22884/g.52412 Transcript_22884/m.52412 type:complete len:229 (-) Transcript_22884:132-818(-)
MRVGLKVRIVIGVTQGLDISFPIWTSKLCGSQWCICTCCSKILYMSKATSEAMFKSTVAMITVIIDEHGPPLFLEEWFLRDYDAQESGPRIEQFHLVHTMTCHKPQQVDAKLIVDAVAVHHVWPLTEVSIELLLHISLQSAVRSFMPGRSRVNEGNIPRHRQDLPLEILALRTRFIRNHHHRSLRKSTILCRLRKLAVRSKTHGLGLKYWIILLNDSHLSGAPLEEVM